MPRPLAVAILALVAILLLAAIGRAWRRRVRRSEAMLPPPAAVPGDRGTPLLAPVDAIYVSTTLGGSRYERVAGYTLGARSTATIEVTSAGVLLLRPATRSVFIPAAALREVGTSGGMVGKYVGGEGLVVLRWQLGDHVLDTGLRLGHRADVTPVLDAVRTLITQASAPRGEPPDLRATPADEAHPATPEDPGPARPSDEAPADQTSDRAEGPRTDDEGRP